MFALDIYIRDALAGYLATRRDHLPPSLPFAKSTNGRNSQMAAQCRKEGDSRGRAHFMVSSQMSTSSVSRAR